MNIGVKIAQDLLRIQAIKLNPSAPFTWASGMRSPIYCDNRITLSFPDVRTAIRNAFVAKIKEIKNVEAIIGVATGGIAQAAIVADAMGLPMAYVRAKTKEHGRKNLLEGELKKNARVVVIEDLISTGGSSLLAINALVEQGIEVLETFSIFTYGLPIADKNFEAANQSYHSLVTFKELLQVAISSEYIDSYQEQLLNKWNKDPKAWSDHYLAGIN